MRLAVLVENLHARATTAHSKNEHVRTIRLFRDVRTTILFLTFRGKHHAHRNDASTGEAENGSADVKRESQLPFWRRDGLEEEVKTNEKVHLRQIRNGTMGYQQKR